MGFTPVNLGRGRSSKAPRRTEKSARLIRKIPDPKPNAHTTSIAPNHAQLPNPFAFAQQRGRANPPLDPHFLEIPTPRPPGPPRLHVDGVTQVPTLYPTLREFSNPQTFYHTLGEYEKYGMVKVIPPREMLPAFGLDTEILTIKARHQIINQTMSNEEIVQEFNDALRIFHSIKFKRTHFKIPLINKRPLNLYLLHRSVQLRGGTNEVSRKKLWQQIGRELGYSGKIMSSLSTTLRTSYQKILTPFDEYLVENGINLSASPRIVRYKLLPDAEPKQGEIKLPCGILITMDCLPPNYERSLPKISGAETKRIDENAPAWMNGEWAPLNAADQAPVYNLKQFQVKAKTFHDTYFRRPVTEQETEAEYWRLLENPGECLGVEYGYTMRGISASKTSNTMWDGKTRSQGDGSFLQFIENDNLAQPSTEVGMLFATKAWTAEPYLSAKFSYSYMGAPRTCYSVPPTHFEKMMNHISIRNNTEMATPAHLKSLGIECYAADQYPGEVIIVFPRSWHSHFNQGFNLVTSSHFMQGDWLPTGRFCLKFYNQLKLRAPFPFDQLILDAATSFNCGVLEAVGPELKFMWNREKEFLEKFSRQTDKKFSKQVCVDTNQVMCLSWIDSARGPINPQFAERGDGSIVTAYGDVDEYFGSIIKDIEAKLGALKNFISTVCKAFAAKQWLSEDEVKSLINKASQMNRAQNLALSLQGQIKEARKLGSTGLKGNSYNAINKKIDAYSKLICDTPELYDLIKMQGLHEKFLVSLDDLIKAPQNVQQTLSTLSNTLRSYQISSVLQDKIDQLHNSITWAKDIVCDVLSKPGILFLNKVEQILNEATTYYGISSDSAFMKYLTAKYYAGLELKPRAGRAAFLETTNNQEVSEILELAKTVPIEEAVHNRLSLKMQVQGIVNQMNAPDVMRRPRFSEAIKYQTIDKQIGWAIMQCEKWYQAFGHANQLLLQVEAAGKQTMLEQVMQVNLQMVLQLLEQMGMLQVIPDNLEAFQSAYRSLKMIIDGGNIAILGRYGFI